LTVHSPEELLDFLRSRRTVRQYRPERVERTHIELLLEAARWAPSPHNVQPWRFAVLTDPGTKSALAAAMGQAWAVDLERDGMSEEFIRLNLEGSKSRLESAAAVVVVCMTEEDLDEYPDDFRASAERTMAIHSIGAAIQNMGLMAHSLGLGLCWMCAPLFCPKVVKETLDLPAEWQPQALLTLGWPAETPAAPRRKPLSTLARWFEPKI
jgi:F420 biosynthesis protein FbiB-like protein